MHYTIKNKGHKTLCSKIRFKSRKTICYCSMHQKSDLNEQYVLSLYTSLFKETTYSKEPAVLHTHCAATLWQYHQFAMPEIKQSKWRWVMGEYEIADKYIQLILIEFFNQYF